MLRDFQGWMRNQRGPVSMAIAGSLIITSLILWFTHLRGIDYLLFGGQWLSRPWTLFTYPWAYMPLADPFSIITFIFLVLWISWMGPPVERAMGSGRYAVFMLVMTALPALLLWLGMVILHEQRALGGPWLPVAGMTMAWCTRNPTATISLFAVIPISGKWLGWLEVATVYFTLGFGSPILGLFAVGHLAVAWAFAANRLPIAFEGGRQALRLLPTDEPTVRGGVKYDERYYDEVRRREQERNERDRLRKLFGEPPDDEDAARR